MQCCGRGTCLNSKLQSAALISDGCDDTNRVHAEVSHKGSWSSWTKGKNKTLLNSEKKYERKFTQEHGVAREKYATSASQNFPVISVFILLERHLNCHNMDISWRFSYFLGKLLVLVRLMEKHSSSSKIHYFNP